MAKQIFILSDGTGRTAQQALNAALTQFEQVETILYLKPNIRSEDEINDIFREAKAASGIIIHTLVSKQLRDTILHLGKLYELVTIDIMGPLLAQLSEPFENSPSEKPGLFHDLNKAYFQRIEAMEFAIRHDDGQKYEELDKAEIVLLGVSRTFKTPLSMYLAFKGWFVANIPIVLCIKPPEILNEIPPERVFCLTTLPNRLAALRKVREKHLGGATGAYSDNRHVQNELEFANRLYSKNDKWTIINITNKPIEEIASEILGKMRNS